MTQSRGGGNASHSISAHRSQALGLTVIFCVYIALSLALIRLLPLWGGVHDEPMFFGYCKFLAVKGQLPTIGTDLGVPASYYYLHGGAGEASHHPPGYPALGSLVYRAFSRVSLQTQNYALRFYSLFTGIVALLFLYGLCRELLPEEPLLTLAIVSGVAVFPQWLLMSSVIYVENFGAMAAMGALWMLTRYARSSKRWGDLCAAGVFVGLMALTKMTLLAFCLAAAWIALTLILKSQAPPRTKLLHGLSFFGAAALVAGWWYLRNVIVYGQLFPTSVVAGQLDTTIKVGGHAADMLTLLFIPMGRAYYALALTGSFHSFWCPTDWLPSSTRPYMYSLAALTWVLLPIGLRRGVVRRDEHLMWIWKHVAVPFIAGFAVTYFLYVRWTVTTAIQAHGEFGKFVMPVFGFMSLLFALSLKETFGSRYAFIVAMGFILFFVVWDLLAMHHLSTVLIPRYAPAFHAP